jgi:hypothetical protein
MRPNRLNAVRFFGVSFVDRPEYAMGRAWSGRFA